jgi:hypothetical protein
MTKIARFSGVRKAFNLPVEIDNPYNGFDLADIGFCRESFSQKEFHTFAPLFQLFSHAKPPAAFPARLFNGHFRKQGYRAGKSQRFMHRFQHDFTLICHAFTGI